LPGGARFCLQCGQAVGAGTAPPSRSPAPDTYTPKHLAEKILTSKAALEGERKQVTVLFADLKGSMELLADRDPEEARKILDPVLERMMEAVHRYEGTVNQVMGDGIMALFGAPLAHEDHAVRACYAALGMQEAVKRYAQALRREQGVTLRIRVGLNSGEVVVRAIGSDLHMDYTAVGQTTHLAARMEQLADPGSVLLSPATLELVEGYVEVKPLGPLPVKGLPAHVEVYELASAGAVRSRLHAAVARGLTRFVGRDSEVDQLRQALERAQAGHGQVVAVVGEPGVGKSRLYWEFTHSHRAHGWLILESGSVFYGKVTAFLPVIDLLKAYFHIEGRDDARTIREKVTGKVLPLDRGLEPSLSALLSLLEVPVEDEAWGRLDPPQRRQRTLDAVKRLLLRESQVQPLMLLVEDLHWIDAETQALLDSLVESLPTARLLLLANYRPEYQHPWGGKTYYRQLRIDPLPAESADDLLTGLLGTDESLDALKRTLIERTEGNPLFLEESVRSLAETRALIGERGAYRLAQDAKAIQVPPTVQAILAARIDRLPPEDKRLLQAASVIGKDVPFGLLLPIAELGEEDLRRGLAHLQAAEFLYETSLFPELEYTFKHALTHEVTYGGLLQQRRRALHLRVLDALERLLGNRTGEQAHRLAEHALRAEDWRRAARYLHLAGQKALLWGRFEEAERCLEGVKQAVSRQEEPRDRSLELDADLELWVCRIETGRTDGLKELAANAEALAEELHDPARLAQVRLRKAQAFWLVWGGPHALEVAVDEAREAFEMSEATDLRTRTYARFIAGAALIDLGRLEEAIVEFDRGLTLFAADGGNDELTRPILASLRAWRARALAIFGGFADALPAAREAVALADELGHAPGRVWTRAILADVCLMRGDFTEAASTAAAGLEISQGDLFDWVFAHLLYLARTELARGDLRGGTERRATTMRQRDSLEPFAKFWTKYGTLTAGAWLAAGDVAAAEAEIDRALPFTELRNARCYLPTLFRLRSEVLVRRESSDFTGAATSLERGLELAMELGLRPEIAHCHFGLGRLYRRTGKRERAQEHLTTATTMYREIDMPFWLEKAEAEVRDLG
jgi:class 3 adenylate cyclase/tetratricopeptide (TPR) repeat protein